MEILSDFDTSVNKALNEIDENYMDYTGLIVCGTHSTSKEKAEMLITKISIARRMKFPYLGICFGHQLAAIEYARSVLDIEDATSEEFGEGTFVVKRSEKLKVGEHQGQSYWNNYEISIDFEKPDYFITTQYHPEYQSSKDKPHPDLVRFIELCRTANAVGHLL